MLKNYEQYQAELEHVYEEVYSHLGQCSFFEMCSSNMEKPKFQCDFAARVGVNYGSGKYPKVLMLGQEGTTGHTAFAEPSRSLQGASKQHYPKTLYTLALILNREQPKSWAQEDLQKYEGLFTHYALTNYYKCAFSNDSDKVNGLSHNNAMKNHCYKLLLKEMDVLEPDLMVVQGKFTTEAFWVALDQKYNKGVRVWGNRTSETDTISLYQHKMNGRPFYILYSYHPAAIGLWSRTLNDLITAIQMFHRAYDFENI